MFRKILFVFSDGLIVQMWCEIILCFLVVIVMVDNCCIYYVNVYLCLKVKISFCGFWIFYDGQVFMYLEVFVGLVQIGNWMSYVLGFYESGLMFFIVYFKVVDMYYVLEIEINVVLKLGE